MGLPQDVQTDSKDLARVYQCREKASAPTELACKHHGRKCMCGGRRGSEQFSVPRLVLSLFDVAVARSMENVEEGKKKGRELTTGEPFSRATRKGINLAWTIKPTSRVSAGFAEGALLVFRD